MIKNLQRKFILIAMLATIIITGTIFGIIAIESYRETNMQTDALINLIVENNGSIPDFKSKTENAFITKETKYSTRYFTFTINNSNEIENSNMQNIAAVSLEDAKKILENVLTKNRKTGFYGNYKFKIVQINDNKRLVVFLDCTLQRESQNSMIKKSLVVMGIGYIVVFFAISIFSKIALKPFVKNMEQQKQFITNAGHELKTPLAVIIADIDVLELTTGEDNEWVASIKNQAYRLNVLIKNLLKLANIEESRNQLELTEFSLTNMVKETINDFKALLQNREIKFDENKDIKISADETSIKQLITIFLDNAIKYTDENGIIDIKIDKQGRFTKFEIANTYQNINKINVNKLFDRFYRGDKSRNKKKEGYGIGLSIAESIVDMHKGKINAYVKDKNMICFRVIIKFSKHGNTADYL